MRIGVAGTGRIGAFHAETLKAVPEVESLVLADIDPERANAVATKLGVRAVRAPEDLFGSGIDGLVVAAATDAHARLTMAGADAGIPVFCEKPVAPDTAGTVEVVRHVARTGARVQVGFQRRFDAGFVAAREAVQSGRLGWVHTMRASTLDPAPPPAEYIRHSGGLFRDCCVHDIDAVRWVTGRAVVEVYAVGANRGADFFREYGDVDTAGAVLTLDDETIVFLSSTRYNAAGYDVRLEVFGSRRTLVVGLDDRVPLTSAEPGVDWPTGTPYPNFMDRFQSAYVAELTAFADLVAGRAETPCTPADALETFYVAEACELSRREHRPVRVDEVRL
jgi:myo-inositol 2-dehydrogenase/D-chiro-inositol 1-dehydrogenase